jgi:hypothetical protein
MPRERAGLHYCWVRGPTNYTPGLSTIPVSYWDLTSDDGAYINGEFFDVPASQVVRDLFPNGPPKPVSTRLGA